MIHDGLEGADPAGYAPGTLRQIEAGRHVPATALVRARRVQERLRRAVDAALAEVDALASPAVPFVAPHEDPEIADGDDSEMLASGFANLTGHPALTLPAGLCDGLPVGLQMTGRREGDAALLACAAMVERLIG